ncbi:MAG: hypothetical protein COU69_00915 [Candidatus Pacebacteria bacterium CG10_big_fil_rev_8_21_14_0_10_56_10]|nr:MAG: hypothetical protein COU69_00915 [Candidatus Pacebacteria bacterium CG10_big_fil_rev_8_21_14_0_10_56_10]
MFNSYYLLNTIRPKSSLFRSKLGLKSRAGFTLIELLVVIAIIAILVAIGITAFSSAQKSARDATRRADMKSVQAGFEQYFLKIGAYAACATMFGDATVFPEGTPLDPTGASYSCGTDALTPPTKYAVFANLEVTGSGNSCGFGSAGTCKFSSACGAASLDTFCVQSLQ